jgi:hypothetical protein
MGLRPTQGNEKRLGPASTLYGIVTLSLSSRGAADSLRRVGREMTKLVPSAASKGETEGCPRSRF